MSEIPGFSGDIVEAHDWNAHYNDPKGMEKVAKRQAVYSLRADGLPVPDYDQMVIDTLQTSDTPRDATIVDIGCSYPRFLFKCRESGFSGKLIGMEPNSAQFNGLAFWRPRVSIEEMRELRRAGRSVQAASSYILQKSVDGKMLDIILYEAEAGINPLADQSVDAATSIFSGYHAFKERRALNEVKRILKPGGKHIDVTSGNENKQEMIEEDEPEISEELSSLTGVEILHPPALQAGYTSEDTIEHFPEIYRHMYVKWIRYEIDQTLGKDIILDAHRTYRDSYRPLPGPRELDARYRDLSFTARVVLSEEIFEEALHNTVAKKIDRAIREGRRLTVKVRRTKTVASDMEIELPEEWGYEHIST